MTKKYEGANIENFFNMEDEIYDSIEFYMKLAKFFYAVGSNGHSIHWWY